MIAIYTRVSTKQQKTDSQEAEIQKWLDGHGIRDGIRWYSDHETGKTLDRSGFRQLQKDIFNGEVRTVVVWKLDRLSRRLRDGVNLLSDWCDRGVRVVVITQQIDLSGPVGRMIAAVLLGLAEIELEFRRERQAAGIEVAKKKGVYRGRKRGTTKGKPTRAAELADQGLKLKEIAAALGVSVPTAWRYLKSAAEAQTSV